ncbi:DUF805 domain-containing protein [Benzoatithermus flavus]|uniref:DUF805 domain-containing protein n=1 Tax=Benzoatithermus flavus TaxID=3108223 RepID=A0ABU8XTI5_9PROT
MDLTTALFSLNGRLSRLAYFGYGSLAWAIGAVLIVVGAVGLAATDSGHGAQAIGLLLVLSAVGFIFWTSIAIAAKRLHDLGLSALNLVWICLLDGVCSGISEVARPSEPVLAFVLSLVPLGVGLWLLFAPGQPHDNPFGPASGKAGPQATSAPA